MITSHTTVTHKWSPSFSVLDGLLADIHTERARPTVIHLSREHFRKLQEELRHEANKTVYPSYIYPTEYCKWPKVGGVEIRPEGE